MAINIFNSRLNDAPITSFFKTYFSLSIFPIGIEDWKSRKGKTTKKYYVNKNLAGEGNKW